MLRRRGLVLRIVRFLIRQGVIECYILRISRCDGGEVVVVSDQFQLHPILDMSDRKRLARACNGIIRETTPAREWSGFPPVGADGGGLLVLLPDPESPRFADAVYRLDHSTGELG